MLLKFGHYSRNVPETLYFRENQFTHPFNVVLVVLADVVVIIIIIISFVIIFFVIGVVINVSFVIIVIIDVFIVVVVVVVIRGSRPELSLIAQTLSLLSLTNTS